MDSRIMMIMVCMIAGMGISMVTSAIMPPLVIIGVMVATMPGVMIYLVVKRSGVDPLIRRPVKGEVLVLYISGTRRIFALVGRELMERYIKLPGYGRVRVTRGSDYIFMGWKTVIAMAGCAHTLPIEKVRQAMMLKKAGLNSLAELEQLVKDTKLKGLATPTTPNGGEEKPEEETH